MKRQLSSTIYGLKFAMKKNDFERLMFEVNQPIFLRDPPFNKKHASRCDLLGSTIEKVSRLEFF